MTSTGEDKRTELERREAGLAIASMESLFKPKAVAVIGASRERGTIAGELFHNILEAGFQGPVYPVNKSSNVVQSVVAYKSVLDCPGPVDLAIITVPAAAVIPVARECAEKGVKAIVVISAGFGETDDEGMRLQQELAEICRRSGMRLVGPNCMGIVNTHPSVRLNAQFSPLKPTPGKIGFLSQSGALGIAIIDETSRLGLGLSTFISVGNKADVSGNDLVQYWENDESTDVILMYLESFGNPRKFARIARRILKKKPLVVVKSGRSSAGFRATQSHTGALVSTSDVTVDALFRQSGVIRTDTLSEMLDVAAFLATQPIPRGNGVAIITNAGGAGILASDSCEDLGLAVPELSQKTQDVLRRILPPQAGFRNPVDMIASATAMDYGRVCRAVAEDPSVDTLMVMFVPPIAVKPEDVAREILKVAEEFKGRIPILVTFLASHGIPELLNRGDIKIPSYPFPESAARALAHAVEYGNWLRAPQGKHVEFMGSGLHSSHKSAGAAGTVPGKPESGGRWLSEKETRLLLVSYGIELVKAKEVFSAEEAGIAALEIGGMVVLKALAPGLLHKTEAGAVAVGLSGGEDVAEAARKMAKHLQARKLEVAGFLVQKMAAPGVEMLVGVTNDPLFGPVIACGAGGVLVELLNDISVRITPITDIDAQTMISSLKTFPRLTGYRGGERHDVRALEELILRVAALVEDIQEISELDLNPVIVHEEGRGLSIVDARVHIGPSPLPGAKRRQGK